MTNHDEGINLGPSARPRIPMPGRHVLAFDEEGSDASGVFDLQRWVIRSTDRATIRQAGMVSMHELAHSLLNATTAWGGVLSTHASLGQTLPRLRSRLPALVNACRRSHESYSTFISIRPQLQEGHAPRDILENYASYVIHAERALALTPDDAPFEFRAAAVSAAVRAAMQSPTLVMLGESGILDFKTNMISGKDRPDRRLEVLSKCAQQIWTDRPWVRCDDFVDLCERRYQEVLNATGMVVLGSSEFIDKLYALAQRCREDFGPGFDFVVDTDTRSGLDAAFNDESAYLRTPRTVILGSVSEFMVIRDSPLPHALVRARSSQSLRRQFTHDEAYVHHVDGPIVAMETLSEQGQVHLAVFASPDDLKSLIDGEPPVFGAIDYECLSDETWMSRWGWMIDLPGFYVILDRPLDECLPRWWAEGATVSALIVLLPELLPGRVVFILVVREMLVLAVTTSLPAAASIELYLTRQLGARPEEVTARQDILCIVHDLLVDEATLGIAAG